MVDLENIRRMFYRWLTVARAVRHRRITLQRKEDEMNFSTLSVVWDKWRDRFVDEKLRPIVGNSVKNHIYISSNVSIGTPRHGPNSKEYSVPCLRNLAF